MRKKYYFEFSDSEICHTEDYFQDRMIDEGLIVIEVYEAIPDKISGMFWCKVIAFCGDDTADSCGKQCNEYSPRNGKSGCCKHHTAWLYYHSNKITLSLNTT